MGRWEKLNTWKLADKLALDIYLETKKFPEEEIYGLVSQLRRAVLSVPTNIVEGYSRKGDKELSRYLDIAFASLNEVKYLLYFSKKLRYIQNDRYDILKNNMDNLGRKLWKFMKSVRDKL